MIFQAKRLTTQRLWLTIPTVLLWATSGEASAQAISTPPVFVENRGQWEETTLYVARYRGGQVRVEGDRLRLESFPADGRDGWLADIILDGAEASVITARGPQPGAHHFVLGNDPSRWVREAVGFSEIEYAGRFPGVELVLRTRPSGLELTLHGSPVALDRVRFRVDGAAGVPHSSQDGLAFGTGRGDFWLRPHPSERAARAHASSSRLALDAQGHVRVIPPRGGPIDAVVAIVGLEWSTFLGGTGFEELWAVGVDGSGAVTVAGHTFTSDFPTTPGSYQQDQGVSDGFITRIAPSGSTLIFSTYLGGASGDVCQTLAVATDGRLAVAGRTSSLDFPVSPSAIFPTKSPIGGDAFLSVFESDGFTLIGSTYIGGPDLNPLDSPHQVAFSPDGCVVAVGSTGPGWPTTPGVVQPEFSGLPGSTDGFISKLPLDCSQLAFSTYFASIGVERLSIDSAGTITVACLGSIPLTPNAFNKRKGIPIARLSADGTQVLYGTRLGGSNGATTVFGVHGGEDGSITVGGYTLASDFPSTPNAFDPIWDGSPSIEGDGFITRISPAGNTLEFSTFLGGWGSDNIRAMSVDSAGTVTVLGGAEFPQNFPTLPGGFTAESIGDSKLFVARLHPTGTALTYSSFIPSGSGILSLLGGPNFVADPYGAVVYGLYSADSDYPVTEGAFDTVPDASFDGVVTRLSVLPLGTKRLGVSTPGSQGPIAIGVLGMPQAGWKEFGFTSTNGPPFAQGLLALSLGALERPVQAGGAQLWLDPKTLLALVPVESNAKGYAEIRFALPPVPDLTGYAQFLWPGSPAGGMAASNALEITLQR